MFRPTSHIAVFLTLAVFSGCGSCDRLDPEDGPIDVGWNGADAGMAGDDASEPGDVGDGQDATNANAGDAGNDTGGNTSGDAGGSDASSVDGGGGADGGGETDMAAPACGDGAVEGAETCDDGNTVDGDYCSADCSAATGSCGDGVVQNNEACDDQSTTDCAGTHDGGDGTCVSVGTCSSGYSLDSNGNCVTTNTTGLPTPCSLGSGQTLFKFHYDNGSTSARIDVWDASCSYSFAPNSACNVREVYPGFGDVGRTSDGYPVLTSTEYIRVRYSVAGINFSNATLYVRARSYATSSSTNIEAWSPIYGGVYVGPVDNDFVYDWYAIDWSNFLSPSDDPNLTAIQLYAYQGSNSLAVRAVELCLE